MSGFFTRPDFSDTQFKQLSGSTINLSGTTNIVGKLKSKGIEIDAAVTGATTGSVLTYIGGGKIKLSNGAGGSLFNSNRTTTRAGIPAVTVSGATINQFLDGYFFPPVAPGSIINGGATRYFGNNASVSLTYTATRNTYLITSIKLDGVTIALTNGGNTQSGATGKTLTLANTNQTFTLAVKDSTNVTTNGTTSVIFSHKRYFYGDNTNLIGLSNSGITANLNSHDPANAEFSTTKVKAVFNLTMLNQFFYYVIPSSFGTPSFEINGLTNTDFTSQTFTFTNIFGYASTFVIWRTNNLLNGNFSFAIS